MKYKYNGEWKELTIKALDGMPIGAVIAFAGTTIPTGWLECDGSTITQSAYPELYALIGGTLPNFKGRVIVGQDTSDTDFDTIGETGGSKELQAHSHTKLLSSDNYPVVAYSSGSDVAYNITSTLSSTSSSTTNLFKTNSAGTGDSGNLQPYGVAKWIIKAKNTTPTMASIVNAYSTSTTDGYSANYVNNNLQSNGIVLFENASGVMTQITIENDAISHYKYIDIYNDIEVVRIFKTGYAYATATFYSDRLYQPYCVYQISESNNDLIINPRYSGNYYDGANHNTDNKTYKIIGYK